MHAWICLQANRGMCARADKRNSNKDATTTYQAGFWLSHACVTWSAAEPEFTINLNMQLAAVFTVMF